MTRRKAFFVVGHRHWGKSDTLRTLTNGMRSIVLEDQTVPVRRMSNDDVGKDYPERFWAFIDDNRERHMLVALCPNFDDDRAMINRRMDAPTILEELRTTHDLFFWVIKHSQNPCRVRQLDDAEVQRLRTYGAVQVFTQRNATREELATSLRAFVRSRL